jgi:hypothetical protein
MNAVAVGAYRRLPVTLRDGSSVDALLKFFRDGVVTFSASQRHIKFENWRLRILGVENLMRAVAVSADCGFLRAGGHGMAMNALRVGSNHLRALPAILHHEFLAVARAASRGNVGMIDS